MLLYTLTRKLLYPMRLHVCTHPPSQPVSSLPRSLFFSSYQTGACACACCTSKRGAGFASESVILPRNKVDQRSLGLPLLDTG